MSKPVILTGLRANNDLHVGNYFGALLPIIDIAKYRSDDFQVNLFVPDLHSFTTPIDHSELKSNVLHTLKLYVASGLPLDNDSVHIYRQSYIHAHSELTWILNAFTGMGEMSRMIQFKDKSAKETDERISVALFDYPVLMAADILLYDASYVPIGDDQTQHLEFTRDIAARLNARFGELFTVPKAVKEQIQFFERDQALRIKDLIDPLKKMSKSDDSGKGVIFLSESPETAKQKIMSATTDSIGYVNYDLRQQPGISNLIDLLSLVNNQPKGQLIADYSGQTVYGPLKTKLSDSIVSFLERFKASYDSVDEAKLMDKLEASEKMMNIQAEQKLARVQTAVGLR
jgi:tryptophanyl-tRNA synthetase